MIPGLTTRISEEEVSLETTITPKSDLLRITSTTSTTVLATIVPPFAGFSGMHIISNESGASITTVTTGNIATAITIGVNVAVLVAFSKLRNKYIVGALA